jgi:polysaccharide biosynthesis/export protein
VIRDAALWVIVAGTIAMSVQGASAQKATAPQSSPAAAVVEVHAPPDYVIGPLDVLEVLFWRDKELSAEVIVRPDGRITLPLINEVDAGGLTPEELSTTLTQRARRFVEDPSAVVRVKEINSRKVFIMGEVSKPGTYPLGGPTSILQLIATAGGLTEFADRGGIVLLRTLAGRQERYRFNYKAVVKGKDVKQNLELKTGDTVIVP